jgi:sugar phosphate isomerase/epimerase
MGGQFHPRMSVSSVCTFAWELEQDLQLWDQLGIEYVGIAFVTLEAAGLDQAVARLQRTGLRISNLIGVSPFRLDAPSTWTDHYGRMSEIVDAAADVDAEALLFTTGPWGAMRWEEAAVAFADAFGPVLDAARRRSVTIGLENTGALRYENGFVTTLADTVDLARSLGVNVCAEMWNAWMERDLRGTLRDAAGMLSVIQLSDYVPGTHDTPNRAVPGDGMMPLGRIVQDAEDAGYSGPYELEILGPRIEAEGPAAAVARGVRVLDELLTSVGVTV